MRITGTRMIELAAASTQKAQQKVADTQETMSSGLRVGAPSDDPTAWLAAHRAQLRKDLSVGTGVGMGTARDRLTQLDGVLAAIQDAVTQAQALAVQGAQDTYDAADRVSMANQVQGLFANALGAANTQAPNGEFLLAGTASLTTPFTATGAYVGNAGTRSVPTTEQATATVSIPGSQLTAANGVDVLPLLASLATALATNNKPAIQASLTDFDTAVKQLSSIRSSGGSAVNVIDQADQARVVLEENISKDIAKYVEADAIGTATELARVSQALDVSRTVATHVIDLLGKVSS